MLGFDTSTAATAACLLRADGEAFEVVPPFEALRAPPTHARELLPAVAELLERSGLGWDALDAIAVGIGPGAFSGLRIGVATARALARARGVPLRPVSSLAALAEGIEGDLALALTDAKRGELFVGLYGRRLGAAGREALCAPFVASPEAVAERLRDARAAPLAAGDGSVRFRGVLETAGIRVEPDGSHVHAVRGLHVCRLAAAAPAVAPEAVLPEYLRPPDAKPRSE